jgi:hypothetical protein
MFRWRVSILVVAVLLTYVLMLATGEGGRWPLWTFLFVLIAGVAGDLLSKYLGDDLGRQVLAWPGQRAKSSLDRLRETWREEPRCHRDFEARMSRIAERSTDAAGDALSGVASVGVAVFCSFVVAGYPQRSLAALGTPDSLPVTMVLASLLAIALMLISPMKRLALAHLTAYLASPDHFRRYSERMLAKAEKAARRHKHLAELLEKFPAAPPRPEAAPVGRAE